MRKRSNAQGDLNGFLDAGSHIQGELHFEDTFRIDGKVTGKVISSGELVVGERGEVDGEIEVRRVYVLGTARGRLDVSERLEIAASGRVEADLWAPVLAIEEGAHFEGSCRMGARRDDSAREAPENVTKMPIAGR